MKRLVLCVLAMLAAAPVRADIYDGFERFADSGSLKPFARDLGGILGSATFHSARPLGFSGFDVGGHAGAQFYPSRGDTILRNKGVRAFGLPWIQAEIGMPYRIDGFIRGMSYEGLTVAGGGLRYGLLKTSDKPWAPQLLVCGVAHAVVYQSFSASHAGGSLVFSMGNSVFNPYLGAGLDHVRLVVRSAPLAPTLNGTAFNTVESRFTAGVQLRPWNYSVAGAGESVRTRPLSFVYLNAAYILVHGQSGAEAGLGMRF
ncbi:MAG: hypothetical protein NTY77_03190 [Elusimicrobia bacterium]|nr:hypothetical protein [Elusimicrobiota bacterium]